MDEDKKIDLNELELLWKKEMRDILNKVGITYSYSDSMELYNELLHRHKEIFGEYHDSLWAGFGMGNSRAQLDTYLLLKIHNMMKCLMERGTNLKEDFYQKNDISLKPNHKEWVAKEDFKIIEFSQLPEEFRNQVNKKYVKRCFLNSEGIYRVEVKDEPIKNGLNGTMDYLLDYNPNKENKFNLHG